MSIHFTNSIIKNYLHLVSTMAKKKNYNMVRGWAETGATTSHNMHTDIILVTQFIRGHTRIGKKIKLNKLKLWDEHETREKERQANYAFINNLTTL